MKRAVSALIVLLLLISILPSATVSAESLYVKKVVSVVYDDSTSMTDDGSSAWAYANYAMQTFCGLLNDDDQLYITYMSNSSQSVELDSFSTNRQNAVTSIAEHDIASTRTPYSSLETAYQKLGNVTQYDENTEFWLVVFTDGALYKSGSVPVTSQELTDLFTQYSARPMPNDSQLNIAYFGIGSDAVLPQSTEDNPDMQMYVSQSSDSREIAESLSKVAHMVSGRLQIPSSDIKAVDSRTVEFSSDLPLLNIAVLLQESQASIVNIDCVENNLQAKRDITLSTPTGNGDWVTDHSLNGKAILIGEAAGENIQPDTYRIEFSEDIDLKSLDIMVEPAIYLKLCIERNGQEIPDYQYLYIGDDVDMHCKICEIGTDIEISSKLLPQITSRRLTITEGDSVIADVADSEVHGITLGSQPIDIRAKVEIKDIAPISTTVYLSLKEPPVYGLIAASDSDISLLRSELKDNESGVRFYMTVDGEKATQLQTIGHELTVDSQLKVDIVQQADGSWLAVPKSTWPVIFTPLGDQEITAELDDSYTASSSIEIKGDKWLTAILDITWPLLLTAFIISQITRKRFKRCTIECYPCSDERIMGGDITMNYLEPITINLGWHTDLFTLFRPCQKHFGNIILTSKGSRRSTLELKPVYGAFAEQLEDNEPTPMSITRTADSIESAIKYAEEDPENNMLPLTSYLSPGNAVLVKNGGSFEVYMFQQD